MPSIVFHHVLINQLGLPHSPPLGVLGLIARLKDNEIAAEFHQFCHSRGSPLRPEDLAKQILAHRGTVGISTMINALPFVLLALEIVKVAEPSRYIVLGGAGMNGIAKNLIRSFQTVDLVCFGEGEEQIVPLVEYLEGQESIKNIPSIAYRDEHQTKITPPAQRIFKLDDLPLPDFSRISFENYQHVPVLASRGCPLKCQFCDVAPSWGRRNTARSPNAVASELVELSERYDVTRVTFVDDLFTLNKRWVAEFCDAMRELGCSVCWRANSHVNFLTEELLLNMVSAGCEGLFFGLESGSDQVLEKLCKGFTSDKARRVVHMANKHVNVSVNFMWGFPFENVNDLKQTLTLKSEVERENIQASLVMLAPLSLAPILKGSKLLFDPSVPNIFVEDYLEIAVEYQTAWQSMVIAQPDIFSAFHHCENNALDELINTVEIHQFLGQALQIAPKDEVWHRL